MATHDRRASAVCDKEGGGAKDVLRVSPRPYEQSVYPPDERRGGCHSNHMRK
ncbi:unnamed protein product [Gongylonema pulchrum]|uniref:Uncharacterized protein n=1 Tax=Gongylonema pulchrum TaxID=637853 RepID=A0A183D5R7_9BILA|nr:unnamed protein product [Gongylonema pulchrum]